MPSAGTIFCISLLVAVNAILYDRVLQYRPDDWDEFLVCGLLSIVGFLVTFYFVPVVKEIMFRNDMWGYDINKNGKELNIRVPESLGIVCGVSFLLCAIMLQPLFHHTLGSYNAALLSICFILLLGFIDDVLELRWSVKILLSFVGTMPLLVEYSGPTLIIVPKPLVAFLGNSLALGWLYHVYLLLLVVFCTNSINIYAGINGLETSQTVVIALSVLAHNFLELSGPCSQEHMNSLYTMLPFLGCVLALAYYNAYPAEAFVGDSFTYFAGMALAVAAIQGHFSKTLMLFFLPQLINFFLSIPQLIGIMHCPRHRLPIYNKETRLLSYSKNLTLINATLFITGPMSEKQLNRLLTVFHILCCILGFAVRYSHTVTNVFYESSHLLSC